MVKCVKHYKLGEQNEQNKKFFIALTLGIVLIFVVAGCNSDVQNGLQGEVNDLLSQIDEMNDRLAQIEEQLVSRTKKQNKWKNL